ncbi:MAG: FRG domain-containing protein [Pseudoclavibacter sp.]
MDFPISPETWERISGLAQAASHNAALSELSSMLKYQSQIDASLDAARTLYEQIAPYEVRLPDVTRIPGLARTNELVQGLMTHSRNLAFAERSSPKLPPPRTAMQPRDLLMRHAITVSDVRSYVHAVSSILSKHHEHEVVWRGQQQIEWGIHSSLYRKVAGEQQEIPTEGQLIAAEMAILAEAVSWGLADSSNVRALATLQHYGAPTRLLDVTRDPDTAAWFAVEESDKHDAHDGVVIGWGRRPRASSKLLGPPLPDIDAVPGKLPWWERLADADADRGREANSQTLGWFPQYTSDRMRAQRGGFLVDESPILGDQLVEVFNEGDAYDWRAGEIVNATSILGVPTSPSRKTVRNRGNLVPMFIIHIEADAKASIREYLRTKGLAPALVYPDLAGFSQYLADRPRDWFLREPSGVTDENAEQP